MVGECLVGDLGGMVHVGEGMVSNLRIKGSVRAQVQQSHTSDDEAGHGVSDDRHIEGGVDLAQVLMARDAAVTGKGPAQPALPGMAGDQTANARGDDKGFQHDGASVVADGLVEEL